MTIPEAVRQCRAAEDAFWTAAPDKAGAALDVLTAASDALTTLTDASRVAQAHRLIAAARSRQSQTALPFYPVNNTGGEGGTDDGR
jgi:hypothetical protein